MNTQQIKNIENWAIVYDQNCVVSAYTPPELIPKFLVGEVNGKRIQTSAIQEINMPFVKTFNSTYKLGKPEPEYKKLLDEYTEI